MIGRVSQRWYNNGNSAHYNLSSTGVQNTPTRLTFGVC